MQRFLASVLVLSAFLAAKRVQAAPEVAAAPVAAQPPLSVELRPEKSAFLLGEPILFDFVVRNASDQGRSFLDGGDFWHRQTFQVEVRDEAGNVVPQPKFNGYNGGFGPKEVPAHGEFALTLFLPHWATFSKSGRYRITAKRGLTLAWPGKTGFDAFNDRSNLVWSPLEASADVEVLPPDAVKLGALIQAWGESTLSPNSRFDSDREKLRSLPDPRVVPFLIRAVESANPNFEDINALGDWNDQAAFAALQTLAKRMSVKNAIDFAKAGLKAPNTDYVRFNAVYAIARSKNPGRTEFLLSLRHDPFADIRLIVAQNLGGLPVERARAIWREMLSDASVEVSGEAKRRLEQPAIQRRPRKSGGGLRAVA